MNILPCQCKNINNNIPKINWGWGGPEGEKVEGILKVLTPSSSTAGSQLLILYLKWVVLLKNTVTTTS